MISLLRLSLFICSFVLFSCTLSNLFDTKYKIQPERWWIYISFSRKLFSMMIDKKIPRCWLAGSWLCILNWTSWNFQDNQENSGQFTWWVKWVWNIFHKFSLLIVNSNYSLTCGKNQNDKPIREEIEKLRRNLEMHRLSFETFCQK